MESFESFENEGIHEGPAPKTPGSRSSTPMSNIVTKPRIKVQTKTERPRLHKVILVNDDYTPREFVVTWFLVSTSRGCRGADGGDKALL